jgi:archaellum component FlaC
LELTKNGIQKTIYAKAGEVNSRALIATLTQNGKVYNLTDCSAIIFLENGDNFEAEIVGDTIKAIIPNAFPEPQIRICELRVSRNNSESVLYSPMFELIFEDSLGNKAEGESLENGVQYVIKQEHDKSDSHTMDMIKGLAEEFGKKTDVKTTETLDNKIDNAFATLDGKIDGTAKGIYTYVDGAFEDYDKVQADRFKQRDNNLTMFAERTDNNIINLQMQDNQFRNDIAILKDKAHRHSNKSVLDNLSDSNGKLLYNGKAIESGSGLTDEQKSNLEANTEARHTHSNKEALDSFGLNALGTRPTFDRVGTPYTYILATTDDVRSSSLDVENKLNGNIQNIRQLPSVSESDNGKFLMVDGGVWAASGDIGGKVKKVFIPYDESYTYGCYTFTENSDTPIYVSNDFLDEHGINEICPVDLTILWEGQETSVAELNKKNITGEERPAFINLMNPRDIDNVGTDKIIGTIYNAIGGGGKSLADYVGFDGTYFGGVYLYYFDKIEVVE